MAEKQNMMEQLTKCWQMLENDDENGVPGKTGMQLNIGMMTEKLLMMFLILPQPKVLSMPVASSVIGAGFTPVRSRSVLLKLVDIGKILQAVGLLAKVKVKVGEGNETIAYQYEGQEVEVMPLLDSEESTLDCLETGGQKEEGGTGQRGDKEGENTADGRRGEEGSSSGREEENTGEEEGTIVGVTEEEEMLVQLPPTVAVVCERKVVRLKFVGKEVEMIVDRKRKRK